MEKLNFTIKYSSNYRGYYISCPKPLRYLCRDGVPRGHASNVMNSDMFNSPISGWYKTEEEAQTVLIGYLAQFQPLSEEKQHDCCCSIVVLLSTGCKCGGK
jgi:hypothetical protein